MKEKMLDSMHRAYLLYKDSKAENRELADLSRRIQRCEDGREESLHLLLGCKVHTDWIEHIEAAMPFIDRAVRENRQFILRVGETVPIEKVRRVSKTSVEHLARHSEYISREAEDGGDLIPDKLLMTENIGTYAVYENRFLYMLLCYIRDFVDIKQKQISALSDYRSSEIIYNKNLKLKKKSVELSVSYREKTSESEDGPEDTEYKTALSRMEVIAIDTAALLSLPLMKEVALSPMIKPPITRTNVLTQNPCFKAAVELYDYLCAYSGKGFEEVELYRHEGKMDEEESRDLSETALFLSYLSYKHTGGACELDSRYRQMCLDEEQAQRAERERKLAELLARVGDVPADTLEYINALEEEIRILNGLRENTDTLIRRADEYKAEAERAVISMNEMKEQRDKAANEAARSAELRRISDAAHANELDRYNNIIRQKDEEYKKTVERMNAQALAERDAASQKYAELHEKYSLLMAKMHANEGGDGADFTSREAFAELEAEYRAFEKFFSDEWKKAKRRIREEKLSKKHRQKNGSKGE